MSTIKKKTWRELISAIHTTFRRWGIKRYVITPLEAPERRDRYHTRDQRMICVTFQMGGKEIVLQQNALSVAHDNLELMAIALETLRINSVRGTDWLCSSAYRQMHGTQPVNQSSQPKPDDNDPYTILGVARSYPLPVIEAIWKQHLRCAHPDAGGSHDAAIRLNVAMDKIRREKIS